MADGGSSGALAHDEAAQETVRRVLVVDDDADAAAALATMVSDGLPDGVTTDEATSLAAAMAMLDATVYDAVVLDLDLPETTGVPTLHAVRNAAPLVPVVVVSGWAPEVFGSHVFRAGGYDYLRKGEFASPELAGAVERAIDRQAGLLAHHDAAEEIRRRLRAEATFQGFEPTTPSTAQSYGPGRVRDVAPAVFDGLVARFARCLDEALEERAFKTEPIIVPELRALAADLVQLRTGPRDVIDIYLEAVRVEAEGTNPKRARALMEEGRVLVLELMGHVVASYRTLVVVDPLSLIPPAERPRAEGSA